MGLQFEIEEEQWGERIDKFLSESLFFWAARRRLAYTSTPLQICQALFYIFRINFYSWFLRSFTFSLQSLSFSL